MNQNPSKPKKKSLRPKRMRDKPIIDELANELIQERRESALKLSDFTPLNEAPDTPIWQTIRALYASRNLADKVKAVILNGVETCRKKQFISSFDILCEYINQDPNIDRVGLNGTEHKDVMKNLAGTLTGAFLECKIQPSKGRPKSGEKGKAGTYEIAHPKVIQRLEWWDDSPVLRDSLRDIPTPVVVDVVVVEDEDVIGDKLKSAIENWHTRGVVPDGFCESVGVSHDELFNAPEGEVERMLGQFFGLNKFSF